MRKRGYRTRAGARVFAKELYDAEMLTEEGWKRVEITNSPKELTH